MRGELALREPLGSRIVSTLSGGVAWVLIQVPSPRRDTNQEGERRKLWSLSPFSPVSVIWVGVTQGRLPGFEDT